MTPAVKMAREALKKVVEQPEEGWALSDALEVLEQCNVALSALEAEELGAAMDGEIDGWSSGALEAEGEAETCPQCRGSEKVETFNGDRHTFTKSTVRPCTNPIHGHGANPDEGEGDA